MADDAALSADQVQAAIASGRLGRLAERLTSEGDLPSLDRLLAIAALETTPLDELAAAARAIERACKRFDADRGGKGTPPDLEPETRSLRRLTASTIAQRLRRDPLTSVERPVLGLAAEIFLAAGEIQEAARLFERADDDGRAADAYAALGDIDKMEACHDRLQARRADRRAVHQLSDRVEELVAAGQRVAALALLQAYPSRRVDEAGLGALQADLDRRLCRGRVLQLSEAGAAATSVRLVCAPAVLGRDPAAEIPLRDPGVSRRHAAIVTDSGHLVLEDAGSRAGTRIGGATLSGRAPLDGDLEITLGAHCRIAVVRRTAEVIELRGKSGLDRSLHVLLGSSALDLALVHPDAAGLRVVLDGGTARLERPNERRVKIGGALMRATCDLLHGDLIEIDRLVAARDAGQPPLRLEVA